MTYVADCGDYVVVTNARNIHVSGKKAQQKVYYHHTMYPGGLKERHFKDLIKSKPEDVRIIHTLKAKSHTITGEERWIKCTRRDEVSEETSS